MSKYNYDYKVSRTNPQSRIESHVEIDTKAGYGWFEIYHAPQCGDDWADNEFYSEGGLWFDKRADGKLELVDYDGVYEISPLVLELIQECPQVLDIDRVFYP